VEVSSDLPLLQVDKGKFYRLFELLLKDEIVSLPEGSLITVSAALDTESPGDINIQVHDNGPGLPKEALRLLFDPFVVRSDSPLEYGINLMACYFIVHHHNGRIQAHSVEGQGTYFSIHIPLNPNQPAQPEQGTAFLNKVLLNDTLWEKLIAA